MTPRRTLPNRRRHEVLNFEHEGIEYHATVSRFDDGGIAEIFLDAGKPGSAVAIAAHDLGVTASLAVQFGTPIQAIRKALLKLSDGSGAGPLGRVLDLLDAEHYAR